MCIGNTKGVLVPYSTTDQEFLLIQNALSDKVSCERIDEKLSALGNAIANNDHTALVNPEISRKTEEYLMDVMKVDVFRQMVSENRLIGSYCCISNEGGMVHTNATLEDLNDLSLLTQIPIAAGTINRGNQAIASGLLVNDWAAFCGSKTSSIELAVVQSVFKI